MKKFILSFAVLAMGMVAFNSCSKNDDPAPGITAELTAEQLTVKVGEVLTITPLYTDVDNATTYEWSIDGTVVATTPELSYTAKSLGQKVVTLKVTNDAGTTVKTLNVTFVENLATVTFEGSAWDALIDNPQYNGTLLYGDDAVSYAWSDAATGFNGGLTLAWGGTYGYAEGGTAISNYIDSDLEGHNSYEYQLAVPVSNGSQNFAVVFCDATVQFGKGVSRVIKSMDIAPTTYELGVVLYGDGYNAALPADGNLTLTITADNGNTLDVDLARNGDILRTWKTIDLTSLGKVNSLSFTMDGSDRSAYGVKQPKYFAFDNVVVQMADPE